MKRWLLRAALGLLVVLAALAGLERYAAESGEVVVLAAKEPDGRTVETRLWVVDHDGAAYLRTGADGSGWYRRLLADPRVQVERAAQRDAYRAVPAPELSERVNLLMHAKYGWRDAFIGAMVGGRQGSIPIRLEPVTRP